MSELVEKVARALFEYDQCTDETQFRDWEKDHARLGQYYRELAGAALQAVANEIMACNPVLGLEPDERKRLRTPPAPTSE